MDGIDNAEAVRRMWQAYARDGLNAILEFAAPDAEWLPYSAHGRSFPTTAAYATYIAEMAERRELVEATLGDLYAEGDCVVVSGRLRLRDPEGIRDQPMHWVHRFRAGKIVFTASYPALDQALSAAGLGPEHRVAV